MYIGFVGAGKVGTAMGIYLRNKGYSISGYLSRTLSSAKKSAILTDGKVYENMEDIINDSHLLFITTPDDIIEDVGKRIYDTGYDLEGKVICHTSGVHSSDILSPLVMRGATVCSLHPMLSFSGLDTALEALPETIFTVEAQGSDVDLFEDFLRKCNNKWIKISPEGKSLYHAAACMASNYLVALMDISIEMLMAGGFKEGEALELLGGLSNNTLYNVINNGAKKALTGPIARGDIGTLGKHMDNIRKNFKEALTVYKTMGQLTTNLAQRAGMIDREKAKTIKELLKDE